ncbi:hypothetical protein D4R89_13860 [bacterium]|nr:MAG: hypothetical protein D4R89_13860 [bacterium]
MPSEDLSLSYSSLPLELAGVIVNSSESAGSVCMIKLRYEPKNVRLFHQGEKAFEIAEIVRIEDKRVIIKNMVSNTLEYLTFLKNKPFPSPQPVVLPLPRVVMKSAGEITVDISTNILHYYTNNLAEILDSAYATPRYRTEKDGKKTIEGFEITRIKKDGIVDHLGFQDGDIILDVNGETLDSIEKVMKFIGQVKNIPQAELTVLRGTKRLKVVFHQK